MLQINLYKEKRTASENYSKIYGRAKNAAPINISGLAKHMAQHNTAFSKGVIMGILTDMVACIKELMLMGQPVKLADLAIFKAAVTSTPADTVEDFDLGTNIKNVRLLAIATGEVKRKQLTEDALLGYTSLAQRIKRGEIQLSNRKKEYIAGTGNSGSGNSGSGEPTVNP